jgi:hypothetical protein
MNEHLPARNTRQSLFSAICYLTLNAPKSTLINLVSFITNVDHFVSAAFSASVPLFHLGGYLHFGSLSDPFLYRFHSSSMYVTTNFITVPSRIFFC